MQPEYVRRNPNGSIDNDFYRRRAARLRRESFRANVKAAAGLIRPAVAAALLIFTLLAMPTHGPEAGGQIADNAATQTNVAFKAN
jgi:hypothetical protein